MNIFFKKESTILNELGNVFLFKRHPDNVSFLYLKTLDFKSHFTK